MRLRTPSRRGLIVVVVLGVSGATGLAGGCGDNENESAACDARNDLDEDVSDLANLDLADTSVNDLNDDFDDLRDDLDDLRTAASDELATEIDDLESSLDDLGSTIGGLGSSDSLGEAVTSIGIAIDRVEDSAGSLRSASQDLCED